MAANTGSNHHHAIGLSRSKVTVACSGTARVYRNGMFVLGNRKKDRKVRLQTVVVKYRIVNVTACNNIWKFQTCAHMGGCKWREQWGEQWGWWGRGETGQLQIVFFLFRPCALLLEMCLGSPHLASFPNRHEKPSIFLLQHQVNIVTRPSNLLKNCLWSSGLNPPNNSA